MVQKDSMKIKMKLKRNCLVYILIMAVVSSLSADTIQNSDKSVLTLNEIVKLVIENGTTIQLSKNKIKRQKVNVKEVHSTFLPEIKTSISTGTSIQNGGSLNNSNGLSTRIDYTFTPSSLPKLRSAQRMQEYSELDHEQSLRKITAEAIMAYIDAVYAIKMIGISECNYKYQKMKLEQVEAYRDAGKKSLSDLLQQQTETAESEVSLYGAQMEYDRKKLFLYDIASLPLNSRITLDTNEFSSILSSIASTDSSVIPVLVLNEIVQFQAKKKEIEAAELTLKATNAAYLPSIEGNINDKTGYTTYNGFSKPDLQASIVLSYPIFDKFNRKQKIQSAQLNLEDSRVELKELEKRIQLDYEYSLSDLKIAEKQLNVANVRVNSAKQAFDAVMVRYESGMSTLLETILANNSYQDAIRSRLNAEISILTSYISIMNITDKINSFISNTN
jgi:outer membrane protein